jgi:SpoVK/Ycf46/Vps4 family AAA+-type ATPase
VLIVGATNRPNEIDEAARRRFRKKLYIPLPDAAGRKALMVRMLSKEQHALTELEIDEIVVKTDGYSGSDMDNLIREAALGIIN